MTSAARCDLTDLLTAECAHCRHRGVENKGAIWEAMYGGECVTCGAAISMGDRLTWAATGEAQHARH